MYCCCYYSPPSSYVLLLHSASVIHRTIRKSVAPVVCYSQVLNSKTDLCCNEILPFIWRCQCFLSHSFVAKRVHDVSKHLAGMLEAPKWQKCQKFMRFRHPWCVDRWTLDPSLALPCKRAKLPVDVRTVRCQCATKILLGGAGRQDWQLADWVPPSKQQSDRTHLDWLNRLVLSQEQISLVPYMPKSFFTKPWAAQSPKKRSPVMLARSDFGFVSQVVSNDVLLC